MIILICRKYSWGGLIEQNINSVLLVIKKFISHNICGTYVSISGFTFVSSVLFHMKKRGYRDNIRKKIKTLLLPYLIINTVCIIVFLVFQNLEFTKEFFGDENNIVLNYSFLDWLKAYGIGKMYPQSMPLWYLRNLFVLNLISPIVIFLLEKLPKTTLIFCILIFIFTDFNFMYLLFPIYLLIWMLGYFVVEMNLNIDYFDGNVIVRWIYVLLSILKLVILVYGLEFHHILNSIIELVYTLVSIIFWYSITCKFSKRISNVLLLLSKYSFSIYIFHNLLLRFMQKLLIIMLPNSLLFQILEYVLLPIVTMLILIPFCNIFNRILPNVYKWCTGNR